MARPFAALGFSVYGALLLAAMGGPGALWAVLWAGAGAGLCWAGVRLAAAKWPENRRLAALAGVFAKRTPLFAMVCLLIIGALAHYQYRYETQVLPAEQWDGKKCAVKARVLDYPEARYHRYYYRLRVEEVDKTAVKPFTIRLSAALPLYCEPYDWVECPVGFYAFDGGGPYSVRQMRLANGYELGGYLAGGGGTRIPCGEPSLGKALAALRRALSREFSRLLPKDEAGLMQAMLLGKKDSLLEDAYEDFRLIGCAHLLAVSGLHVGAVAGLLAFLLGRTRLRPLPRGLLSTAVLLGYLAVTGFPVSGVRAFLMCAVHLLGQCLGRRADGVNSLGLALLLICLQDPFSGGDLSLALSVFATLGILLFSGRIRDALLGPLRKWPRARAFFRPAAGGLGVTLSVMLFTVPWQIIAFRGVSYLSPLANLLLAVPCTLLLYCSLLTLVFSLLPGLGALARPFGFCAGLLCRLARWAAASLAAVPRAYVYLGPVETVVFLGLLAIIVMLCIRSAKPLRWRLAAFFLALSLLGLSCWQEAVTRGTVTLAMQGGGDDACIALIRDHAAAVLQVGEREGSCVSLLRRGRVGRDTALFLPQGTYTGRDLSPEHIGAPVSFVRPGGSFEALPGLVVTYREDGSLVFGANGAVFSVEFAKEGPVVRFAGANAQKSRKNSPFTVVLSDAIIETAPEGLRLAVSPQGAVRVLEGSEWPVSRKQN